MNNAFPDQIYNGIILCLSIQLILIGVFKILKREKRALMLGIFCLLLGLGFFNNLFWNYVKVNAFLTILIGGGKDVLFGPLLFLYIALLNESRGSNRFILSHLSGPLLVHLFYIGIKVLFKEFYIENYFVVVNILATFKLFFLIYFLFLGILLFRKELNDSLKPDVRKRYKIFYFGLNAYFLVLAVYAISTNFFFNMGDFFLFLSRYFFIPVSLIVNTYVVLFALTESKRFRALFVKNKLFKEDRYIDEDHDISRVFHKSFYEDKIFREPGLTIDKAAQELEVSKNVLRIYLKQEYDTNFKEFINKLRVEEFKELLGQESNRSYSLVGISSMVGFQSNATFFRVFKQLEGMTPKEYQNKLGSA
ncbi:helix-turn-helix domain-containing protein [Leptobacterium flavescens]|uniref:Helix-turn-helix domain-containing protein n=1 Tax=Leptobacterium flavescens TaxID=472055 RepID=A0A6P0UMQ1_9FLAO|nr:response regulator transcription factor [Leptobacterium flavescens]NER13740.1 helix-turn-helix domain-containing protein [Leptobacterium flavescens]